MNLVEKNLSHSHVKGFVGGNSPATYPLPLKWIHIPKHRNPKTIFEHNNLHHPLFFNLRQLSNIAAKLNVLNKGYLV